MPTYQYACTECGHGFEAVQSFADDALTECPQCQGRLRKVFGSVGVVFKGSGFYRNDSRDKKASGAKTGDASGGEGKADKPSSSGDKPAAASSTPAKDGSSTTTSSTAGSAA